MKLRRSLMQIAVNPVISAAIVALARGSCRAMLKQVGAITAMTDSSTGTAAGSTIVPVPTQDAKVAQSGSNLASRAAFNTSIGQVNNGLSVLTDWLNTNGFTVLRAGDEYGEGNGTIAVAGTVPAITKTVTGVAGTGVAASGVLTSSANFSNGETVTIGGKVYTFETSLTNVDGHVKIAATEALSITNLVNAINLGAGVPGTDYAAATTINPNVTAVGAAHTVTVTANTAGAAGNAITTTETSATAAWGAATLASGTDGDAMSRIEFNAAVVRARNNLATVVAAYNELAYSLGVPELINNSKGLSSQSRALANKVTATTTVASAGVAAGDNATKAAADAALTALANNIATIAAKISNPLFLTATFNQGATDTVVTMIP